jgi:hypothetical protein
VRRQELPGPVERGPRLIDHRVKGLEDVRHPGSDVEGDLDVGGGGLPRQADRVVEENLVRAGLDNEGRQPGQVGEYGADQAKGRVLPRRVVGDPGGEALPAEQRVELSG